MSAASASSSPPPKRVTVDRGDRRLPQVGQPQRAMAVANPASPHIERFQCGPGVDIGANGERAVAGSGDDHHANVGIAIDLG